MVRRRTKKRSKNGRKNGRKKGYNSVYDPAYHPEQIFKFALLGLTQKEIAFAFGVSIKAIEKWLREHVEFRRSYDLGRQASTAEVAHSLYKRAVGFEHDDLYITSVKGEVVKVPIKKYYPPNVTAAIFYLKNKTRSNENPWQDVQNIKHSGSVGIKRKPVDLSDLTEEELKILADIGFKVSVKADGKEEEEDAGD